MTNVHKYNRSESKALYLANKRLIQSKECYSNIFKVLIGEERFISGEWRVAYGYVQVLENLITRHCFIVNKEGEAICPTYYKINPEKKTVLFASFRLLGEEEYQILIRNNGYVPDLIGKFKEEERAGTEWAKENGYILIG